MDPTPEVLIVTHKYPPSIGGMQKQCFELVKGLENKIKVHVLAHEHGTSKLKFFLSATRQAKKILEAHPSINLVYTNDGLMAFVLSPLLKKTQIPLTTTIHGLDIVFPLSFYQRWIKRSLAKFKAVIAVSQATLEECISRGVHPDKTHLVKNGFDLKGGSPMSIDRSWLEERLRINLKDKKIIISIGRAVRRKGFSWFMNNVMTRLPEDVIYITIGPRMKSMRGILLSKKILPKSLFELIVLFAGLSIDELEISLAAKRPELHRRYFHLEGLSNEEVEQVIGSADLSVMPNLHVKGDFEGFGLVALEAASKGTVCVASRVDGITSAIQHYKNGVMVEPGNGNAWTETIEDLLSNKDLKKLGEQFKNYTMQHCVSWTDMADNYMNVFQKCVVG